MCSTTVNSPLSELGESMPSTNDVARRCEFPYVRGTGHLGLTLLPLLCRPTSRTQLLPVSISCGRKLVPRWTMRNPFGP